MFEHVFKSWQCYVFNSKHRTTENICMCYRSLVCSTHPVLGCFQSAVSLRWFVCAMVILQLGRQHKSGRGIQYWSTSSCVAGLLRLTATHSVLDFVIEVPYHRIDLYMPLLSCSWADSIKVGVVRSTGGPGSKRGVVIVSAFQTDFFMCGIAAFNDYLVVLAYVQVCLLFSCVSPINACVSLLFCCIAPINARVGLLFCCIAPINVQVSSLFYCIAPINAHANLQFCCVAPIHARVSLLLCCTNRRPLMTWAGGIQYAWQKLIKVFVNIHSNVWEWLPCCVVHSEFWFRWAYATWNLECRRLVRHTRALCGVFALILKTNTHTHIYTITKAFAAGPWKLLIMECIVQGVRVRIFRSLNQISMEFFQWGRGRESSRSWKFELPSRFPHKAPALCSTSVFWMWMTKRMCE